MKRNFLLSTNSWFIKYVALSFSSSLFPLLIICLSNRFESAAVTFRPLPRGAWRQVSNQIRNNLFVLTRIIPHNIWQLWTIKRGEHKKTIWGGSEREEISNDHNIPYRDSNGQSSFPSFINKVFFLGDNISIIVFYPLPFTRYDKYHKKLTFDPLFLWSHRNWILFLSFIKIQILV